MAVVYLSNFENKNAKEYNTAILQTLVLRGRFFWQGIYRKADIIKGITGVCL
jgi:hypothetical protein